MLYVKITYSNGYCGCDETEIKAFETMKEAEKWADEYLPDYAESYTHVATGWEGEWENEEDEEEYYENCSYFIEEISEEEYAEDNDD